MNKFLFISLLTIYRLCQVKGDAFQSTLGHIKPQTSPETQAKAVSDLIKRIIPERADDFVVEVNPDLGPTGQDTFKLVSHEDKIQIFGTTGVAAATGFNYFLKYYCNSHISWEASQLNLPTPLPPVDIEVTLLDRFRYYQNVCTTSYSFVWWDWNQWQKHIDWMALNSFNLVLAFNGQEAIWERVYEKLKLNQSDMDEQFSGPAFLSWLRMGNLRGWAGPLSTSWHWRSLILQKQILNRFRDLGIIPVLPAFAGHLPKAFKRLYPDVHMVKMERWNSFNDTYCCPYFLDPTEELFKTIGKMFIEEQISEYGTDHIYNCDSFNEVDPSSTDLQYLANVSKSIYNAMVESDSEAVWMMQGWLFYYSSYWNNTDRVKSFVTSVPLGKMIILDLQSEQFPQYKRLDQYFGQPYIWCMLHNFGGTLGMYGSTEIVNNDPIAARNVVNSTMIGIGLTPEGINQNYVVYDLMIENSWRNQTVNLTSWFQQYALRRYGKSNNLVNCAWQILQTSVYNFQGLQRIRGKYAITATPSLKLSTWTWYNFSDLFQAWDNFVTAADDFHNTTGFLHDLVDITRQVLQVNGDVYYNHMVDAFNNKDLEAFNKSATIFLNIFTDMQTLLSTNEAFLLGRWLEAAKNCANNSEDAKMFEYNARNQITLWGPNGEIMNYANKQWAGVISHFFEPRWSLFIEYATKVLAEDKKFNQTFIKREMFDTVEEPFTFDTSSFPTDPIGDTIEVVKDIHGRWLGRSQEGFCRLRRSFKAYDEEADDHYLHVYNEERSRPLVILN